MNQDMTLPEIRMELTKIRGHLVPMPIDFLIVSVTEGGGRRPTPKVEGGGGDQIRRELTI